MCHQSVGLLQDAIESAGISTISISVRPEVTVNMRVPRAAYVRFPTGNPVGEPHLIHQQRRILRGVLAALEAIREPGTLLEMPYRWRRMGNVDEDRSSAARPMQTASPEGERLSEVARRHLDEIQAAYGALMDAVDRYRAWLEAEVAAERAKAAPDGAKLQALAPQLKYVAELSDGLEGPAHDGLVRVSDRAVRIRHWEAGVFI